MEATARRLGISESTARTHLNRIREKYARAGRPINHRGDYTLRHHEDALTYETLDTGNEDDTREPHET